MSQIGEARIDHILSGSLEGGRKQWEQVKKEMERFEVVRR